MLEKIGILYHPKLPESYPLGVQIAEYLKSRGIQHWLLSAWEEQDVLAHIQEMDLLVTLGGDGTVLRAARMSSSHRVPILAIKVGRLGFLSELPPSAWRDKLPAVLAGEYWIEDRMMLHADVMRGSARLGSYDALNDVVVSRGTLARIVRVATYIDGGYLTTYAADGVIVATPTGSTAYALAVGGPILPPELKNILVIPVAPHLSMDRAIVLSQGASVRLQMFTDHRAMLTVDGQYEVALLNEDIVQVTASVNASRFIRTREQTYFYSTLMDRLNGVPHTEE